MGLEVVLVAVAVAVVLLFEVAEDMVKGDR